MSYGYWKCYEDDCDNLCQHTRKSAPNRCKSCKEVHEAKMSKARCKKHEYGMIREYACLECKLDERDKYKAALEEIVKEGMKLNHGLYYQQIAKEALKDDA